MQKLDILSDGPYRYVHSTETGALLTTLEIERRDSSLRPTGKFIEQDDKLPVGRTMRQWKAIIARRVKE